MGRLLQETERANVERDNKKAELLGVTPPPTLSELGITKRESSEAQRLAELPEEQFQEIKASQKTKTQVFREVKRDAVKRQVAEFPSDKYRVLYASKSLLHLLIWKV